MKANYIQQLQDRVKQLEATLQAAQDGLTDLECYVHSPKFSCGDRLDSYMKHERRLKLRQQHTSDDVECEHKRW